MRRGALVAALLGVLVAACWGVVALYNAPVFRIERIVVEGANHYADDEIRALAKIPADSTLVRVPTADIQRRLEADPWIVSAELDRDFPETLRISVVERRPAAVVDAGGTDLWVVAEDGTWLGQRSAEATRLVVVQGVGEIAPRAGRRADEPQVLNAVGVLKGLSPELRKQVAYVAAPTVDETALRTKDDVEVFIGEAVDMREKDRIVREILRREKNVVYINVRVVDRPTWRGLEDAE